VFRAAETIFDLVREQRHVFDFNVTVQMVEIYNEEMYDLLGAEDNSSSPNGSSTSSSNAYGVVMPFQTSTNATHSPAFVSRRPLGEIRHGERGVYLRNVEAVAVHSAHDVLTVVQNGVVNRTVHSASGSDDHEHSSRSHCVIMIDVQRCSHMDGQIDGGRFVLVDLAGSERLLRTESSDSGQRIREAQHINKSLAAIGDVLSALLAKDKHVPYRNSKITHLLQESLGAADGQTLVLVHVSPTTADVTETVNTLKFAARVNRQQSATKRRSERQEVNRLQGTVRCDCLMSTDISVRPSPQLYFVSVQIATQAAQLQALQDKLASELELRRKYEKRLEEYRQDDHRRRAKDEDRGRLTPQSKQSQGTPTKALGLGQQNSATPEQPYATRRWSLYARK
jgi:kinesin family member C2/C3